MGVTEADMIDLAGTKMDRIRQDSIIVGVIGKG